MSKSKTVSHLSEDAAGDGDGDGRSISELAFDARRKFETGEWDACISTLKRILVSRPNDRRVLHNLAICEFHASGSSNTQDLMKELDRLKPSIDVSASENRQARRDGAFIDYNRAVALIQSGDYFEAKSVLSNILSVHGEHSDKTIKNGAEDGTGTGIGANSIRPLHSNSKPPTKLWDLEFIVLRAALAMLDVCLYTNVSVSADVCGFAERIFDFIDVNYAPLLSNPFIGDNVSVCVSSYSQLSHFLARAHVPSSAVAHLVNRYQRRLKLKLMCVSMSMRGQLSLPPPLPSSSSYVDTAELYFARGSYYESLGVMETVKVEDVDYAYAYHHNLGVLYRALGQCSVAVLHFIHSLRALDGMIEKEKEKEKDYRLRECRALVLYHIGSSLLLKHQSVLSPPPTHSHSHSHSDTMWMNGPEKTIVNDLLTATHCIHAALYILYNRADAWLRYAECIVLRCVVEGRMKKKMAEDMWLRGDSGEAVAMEGEGGGERPDPDLLYATHCIRNALLICSSEGEGEGEDVKQHAHKLMSYIHRL